MTAFVVCALVLVGMTLALLLPPLLRRPTPSQANTAAAANLGILQQQFDDLQTELANGHLNADQRLLAQRELERRVLEETRSQPQRQEAGGAAAGPAAKPRCC